VSQWGSRKHQEEERRKALEQRARQLEEYRTKFMAMKIPSQPWSWQGGYWILSGGGGGGGGGGQGGGAASIVKASLEMTTAPLPELPLVFQTEVVVGWRAWHTGSFLSRHGVETTVLIPVAPGHRMPFFYPPFRRFEALCTTSRHEAPFRSCACGVWALKNEGDVSAGAGHYGPEAWGEVSLWGRVLETKLGYRAQFAYPKSLRCATPGLAEALSATYGVPAVHDRSINEIFDRPEGDE
jgi:hypothetical protein